MDSISTQKLVFDFAPVCSVTNTAQSTQICLFCGKYLAGRLPDSPASKHALSTGHKAFMSLTSGKFYLLPDNTPLDTAPFQLIHNAWNPPLKPSLNFSKRIPAYLPSGTVYYPGFLGLINLGKSNYINSVFQILQRIEPLVQLALEADISIAPPFFRGFAIFTRQFWSHHRFQTNIAPQQMTSLCMEHSDNLYTISKTQDPHSFFKWVLSQLKLPNSSTIPTIKLKNSNVINHCFRGMVEMQSYDPKSLSPKGKPRKGYFQFLVLDLPDILIQPIYDPSTGEKRSVIKPVDISDLFKKYNGIHKTYSSQGSKSQVNSFRILEFPTYLVLFFKRFVQPSSSDSFERNPTPITFPVDSFLNLSHLSQSNSKIQYKLIVNCVHHLPFGKKTVKNNAHSKESVLPSSSSSNKVESSNHPDLDGLFSVDTSFLETIVLDDQTRQEKKKWLRIIDDSIEPIRPEMITDTCSYIQVYKRIVSNEDNHDSDSDES